MPTNFLRELCFPLSYSTRQHVIFILNHKWFYRGWTRNLIWPIRFFLPGIWSWDIGTKSVRWYWARELKSHVELGPQVVTLETHSSLSYRGDKEEGLMIMLIMFWLPIAGWQASPKLSGLQQLIATSCGPVGWLDLVRWFSLGVSHAILIGVWLGLVSPESSAGLGAQDGASTG